MRLLMVGTVAALCGCVSYSSVDLRIPPAPGWVVQAQLATPLDVRLQETTVHDVNVVAGRVLFADPESVVVAVSRFATAGANDYAGLGARIAIPSTAVTHIAHQRISPFRTGLAIGTGVGAMLAVVFSVGQLLGTGGPGGGGGRELP